MNYKINLHAHTIFSDGMNTPYHMALEAKRLEFSALVITDHYYGGRFGENSLSCEKYGLLRMCCNEAKEIIPIIIGMEYCLFGVEVLIFGSGMIKNIIKRTEKDGEIFSIESLLKLKHEAGAAIILCHPSDPDCWEKVRPLLDGYEHYNSGTNYFKDGRDLECLRELKGWCNSDAHATDGIKKAFNIVNSKIENEHDLIKYIKSSNKPEPFIYKEVAT